MPGPCQRVADGVGVAEPERSVDRSIGRLGRLVWIAELPLRRAAHAGDRNLRVHAVLIGKRRVTLVVVERHCQGILMRCCLRLPLVVEPDAAKAMGDQSRAGIAEGMGESPEPLLDGARARRTPLTKCMAHWP